MTISLVGSYLPTYAGLADFYPDQRRSVVADPATVDPRVTDVLGKLAALGSGRQIALFLAEQEVMGHPASASTCPVARFVADQVPTEELRVEIGREIARVRPADGDGPTVTVLLPAPVAQFVAEFDDNRYPELRDTVTPDPRDQYVNMQLLMGQMASHSTVLANMKTATEQTQMKLALQPLAMPLPQLLAQMGMPELATWAGEAAPAPVGLDAVNAADVEPTLVSGSSLGALLCGATPV